MNYEDYICGLKFRNEIPSTIVDENVVIMQGSENSKYSIVYAHTHNAHRAFDFINYDTSVECVLITHNSDGEVRDENLREFDADARLLPPNVVKWYAQNVAVDLEKYPQIVPIPIGLENRYCFPYDKAQILFESLAEKVRATDKLFYANFNPNTHYQRHPLACELSFDVRVKLDLHGNGHDYQDFVRNVRQHTYTISPRGNGLDCHRTWEALYLNSIPVTCGAKSLLSMGAPIVNLDNWSQLSELTEDRGTARKFMPKNLNFHALSFDYWKYRILEGI